MAGRLDRSIPSIELGARYQHDRGPFLAQVYEDHGPVAHARLGQSEVVFLLGPEANRFVLQTHRQAFSYRHGWGWIFGQGDEPGNLLTMDNPEHDWHRTLMYAAFAARRLEGYIARIARIVDRRIARWAQRGEVDAYEETRVITLDVVAELILGLDAGTEVALCRAVYLHGAHGRAAEFTALLRRTIAERRIVPTDDALGLLAQARDERGNLLSDEQLLAHADSLLIAGHETSASLGAWALYLVARHPEYSLRILDELTQLDAEVQSMPASLKCVPVLDRFLHEAERLYPPIPTAPRGVMQDVEFAGHILKAGARVIYSAAATHLLPGIWTDPTRFDPDRFAAPREEHRRTPYGLVGFGGGPRICIGHNIARLELALLVTLALRRYRLSVMPGQLIGQRYGITNRPLHGIRLRVQPRRE